MANKISIITPLYNHEKYLLRAAESVFSQSYSNWEWIIWDDGSKDHSLELARSVAEQNSAKVFVYSHDHRKNLGQEVTRNEALKVSTGEFISLLDSDDFYHRDKFKNLLPVIEANRKCGLVYGRAETVMIQNGNERFLDSGIKVHPRGQVFGELVFDNFVCAGAVLIRRECFNSETKFDSQYKTCGEYPLWIKIAETWEFEHVPNVVAYWRSHGENQGTKHERLAKKELVDLCERLLEQVTIKGNADKTQAVLRALGKKQYDYASILYRDRIFNEALTWYGRVLQNKNCDFKFHVKAHLRKALALTRRSCSL